MGELRKDYLLDKWVVISAKRGKRPHQFKETVEEKEGTCYFCPGNEKLTPEEIGRIGTKKEWKLRWFENKFPAFTTQGQAEIKTANQFFTFSSNYGYHEVIVESNDHKQQLATLSAADIAQVLEVYKQRILDLESKPNIKYVCVFKNHGPKAGTSIQHTHSQVMALNVIPGFIREELTARKKFIECPHCKIVAEEQQGTRKCFENDNFLAFTPYASQYNYEITIYPKEHKTRMEELDLSSLADILKQALEKIHEPGWSYNIIVHYSPKNEDLHFHMSILPRIATWGGFELESGIIINSVPPEDAAAYYRGEA